MNMNPEIEIAEVAVEELAEAAVKGVKNAGLKPLAYVAIGGAGAVVLGGVAYGAYRVVKFFKNRKAVKATKKQAEVTKEATAKEEPVIDVNEEDQN